MCVRVCVCVCLGGGGEVRVWAVCVLGTCLEVGFVVDMFIVIVGV